ncbi:hypothetical protein B7494_g5037 [Chlorociboria aeruginascens]|nr:hypothetical protein B7494_g5037 [Chlorociboria aeruginascens]
MHSLFLSHFLLLTITLSAPSSASDPISALYKPILLGEVFWPPSMTLLAWIPSSPTAPSKEWCYLATSITDSLFSISHPDLGLLPSLQVHDYFSSHAWITKEGQPFAECFVTPESGRMGVCEGVLDWECVGGQVYTGPGTRKWTCWIREGASGNKTREMEMMGPDGLTTGEQPRSTAKKAPSESKVLGAFTPGVTGNQGVFGREE